MRNLSELGKKLRESRLAIHKTAREVAKAAEITPTYLWMIEKPDQRAKPSQPSMEVLFNISRFLDLPNEDVQEILELAGYSRSSFQTEDDISPNTPKENQDVDLPKNVISNSYLLPLPDDFVGRIHETEQLLYLLRTKKTVALVGIGGIGKTALAAKVIQTLEKETSEDKHFESIIVINAASLKEPDDVITEFAFKIGITMNPHPIGNLPDLAHIESQIVANFQRRKILLVVDGVSVVHDVDKLIQVLQSTAITLLIISRDLQIGTIIPMSDVIQLQQLDEDQAITLFNNHAGLNNDLGQKQDNGDDTNQEQHIANIVTILGYHPLAIKLAGINAALFQPDLEQLEKNIGTPEGVLNLIHEQQEPSETITSREVFFEQSIMMLTSDTRTAFTLLGSFATHEFGRNAALRLFAAFDLDGEKLVQLLALQCFIVISTNIDMKKESDRQRIQMHPLLYAYAKQLFSKLDVNNQEHAYRTMSEYYANYLQPAEFFRDLQGHKRYYPDETFIFADYNNTMYLLNWSNVQAHQQINDVTFKMTLGLAIYWRNRWLQEPTSMYLIKAIDYARALPDSTSSSLKLRYIARLATILGTWQKRWDQYEQAMESFDEALRCYQELQRDSKENTPRIGRIHLYRGQLEFTRYHFDKAQREFKSSLEYLQDTPILLSEVKVYLGRLYYLQFKLDDAFDCFHECLEINSYMKHKNHYAMARAYFGLGMIAFYNLDFEEANRNFDESFNLCRKIQDPQGISEVLLALARIDFERGEWQLALKKSQESHKVMRNIGVFSWDAHILLHQGAIDSELGMLYDAKQKYLRALDCAKMDGNHRSKGAALAAMGKILFALVEKARNNRLSRYQSMKAEQMKTSGERQLSTDMNVFAAQYEEAKRYISDALAFAIEAGNRNGEAIDKGYLARIAQAQGKFDEAKDLYEEVLEIFKCNNEKCNMIDTIRFGLYYHEFILRNRLSPENIESSIKELKSLLDLALEKNLYIRNRADLEKLLLEPQVPIKK